MVPWRGESTDFFNLLVAEILLSKTSADRVVPDYSKRIRIYPTPCDLATARTNEIKIIQVLGLSFRASHLINIYDI